MTPFLGLYSRPRQHSTLQQIRTSMPNSPSQILEHFGLQNQYAQELSHALYQSLWQGVTGVAVLHYSNSKGKAASSLPDPPNDVYDTSFSLNQAMSIRFCKLASI